MQQQPSTQPKKEKLENNYFIYPSVNGGSKLNRLLQQITISSNSDISSKGSWVFKILNYFILATVFSTNILTLATLLITLISLLVTWFPFAALGGIAKQHLWNVRSDLILNPQSAIIVS